MESRTSVIVFLATAACLIISITGLNVLVDPFGVFGTGLIPNYDINPRHTKAVKVLHGRYDALILGSCLSSTLRPQTANRLSGHQYFNWSTHNAYSGEAILFLQYAVQNRVPIRQILLNLEGFLSFSNEPKEHVFSERDPILSARLPHFLSSKNRLEFYLPYALSAACTKRAVLGAWNAWRGQIPPIVEHQDGYWEWAYLLSQDPRTRARDVEESARLSLAKRNPNTKLPISCPSAVLHVRELGEFCRANGISVLAFVPPTYALRNVGKWRHIEYMAPYWLEAFGCFYDFALYNQDTQDPQNYLNRENFLPEFGARVLAGIFGGPDPLANMRVTASNLADYRTFKDRQEREFPHALQ